MNGGIFSFVMRTPLRMPQQAAMMAMTMMAAPVDKPLSMMSLARRLQQSAMMPGTDRSMPAEQMANVMPAAPTATHDALKSTLNNWSGCTIFGLMQANTRMAMKKMMKMPYFSATAQRLVDLFMIISSHAEGSVACGALHNQLLVEVVLLEKACLAALENDRYAVAVGDELGEFG